MYVSMHWASLKSANPEISPSWWQDNLLRNPQYPEIQNSSADVRATSSKPSENQIWRFSLTEMRSAAIGSVGYGEPGVSPSTPPEITENSATVLWRGEKGQKPLKQNWRGEEVGGGTAPSRKGGIEGVWSVDSRENEDYDLNWSKYPGQVYS